MELEKIKGGTYYCPGNTNIGVYAFKNKNCLLIDTGINNTYARRLDVF
jgi:glyoxylase-like metal-dependent hydrolase (beta-lactamase superfamily II)